MPREDEFISQAVDKIEGIFSIQMVQKNTYMHRL
jgi:hypothetical protein